MQCLSVRLTLSITFTYSVEKNKHLYFLHLGSHIILVFFIFHYTKRYWQYSDTRQISSNIFDPYLYGFDIDHIPDRRRRVVNFDVAYRCMRRHSSVSRDQQKLPRHASVNLALSFDVTPKTTEQNLIVRICKSEAEIILRSRHCIEKYKACRGLSAIAELLVASVSDSL